MTRFVYHFLRSFFLAALPPATTPSFTVPSHRSHSSSNHDAYNKLTEECLPERQGSRYLGLPCF